MTGGVFSYSGSELEALSFAKNYYSWILGFFAPFVGRHVIEVGAGRGNFSDLLLERATLEQLLLIEPAVNVFPVLQQRYSREPRVTLLHGLLEETPACPWADSAVLINVLEHVEDDGGLLRALRLRLMPCGHLLVFVPANPVLFGTLDRAFGHYRRYTKASLSRRLEEAGFSVKVSRYVNLPGIFTWFIAGRILRKTSLSPREVQIYDRWMVPWIARLESAWPPPFGQSLLVVARNSAHDSFRAAS